VTRDTRTRYIASLALQEVVVSLGWLGGRDSIQRPQSRREIGEDSAEGGMLLFEFMLVEKAREVLLEERFQTGQASTNNPDVDLNETIDIILEGIAYKEGVKVLTTIPRWYSNAR